MGHVETATKNDWGDEVRRGDLGHHKVGRENDHHRNGRADELPAGAASVVLRATIETFGPAGDAELNLTVKWPAATLAASSGRKTLPSASDDNEDDTSDSSVNGTYDTDGTIHTRASTPTGPVKP